MLFLNVVDWEVRLKDLIELDFGLLDYLIGTRVLTKNRVEKIRKASREEAVDYLLSDFKSDNYDKLIDPLEQTDQRHVANFITSRGGLKII